MRNSFERLCLGESSSEAITDVSGLLQPGAEHGLSRRSSHTEKSVIDLT